MGADDVFSPGDTVLFKSGGPILTVTSVECEDEDAVIVGWFNKNGDYQTAEINMDCLDKVPMK